MVFCLFFSEMSKKGRIKSRGKAVAVKRILLYARVVDLCNNSRKGEKHHVQCKKSKRRFILDWCK